MVRGQDLFWSTSIHRLLQALLGLPEPAYHHHKLILDDEGRKLSKSTQATGLRELRAARLKRARYQAHGRARPLNGFAAVEIARWACFVRPLPCHGRMRAAEGLSMARSKSKQKSAAKPARRGAGTPRRACG